MADAAPWSYPETLAVDTPYPPEHVHVAIVGAGLTGLAAGGAIAATGASVAVFETNRAGSGATRHSLGVIAAHYPGGPHHLMRRIGSGKATALWVAAARTVEELAARVELEPVTIRTHARGDRDRERIAWDADWLTERGFPAHITYQGTALEHEGWVTDPLAVAATLADSFEKDGGILCEGVSVTSVSRHTGGYQVLTDAGKTSADAVIIATGPNPDGTGIPSTSGSIQPVDRYGASISMPDTSVVMSGASVVRTRGLTLRTMGRRRVLVSGHVGLRSGQQPEKAAAAMIGRLSDQVDVDILRVEYAWSSIAGLTVDRVPHVWREDGMWFGGGYNGDALVPAIALGTQLGELIGGVRTETVFAGAAAPPRISARAERLRAMVERYRLR